MPRHTANDVTSGVQPDARERLDDACTTRTQPTVAMNQIGAEHASAISHLITTDSSHATGTQFKDEVRPNRTTG